jgi:glycosyltransferase involved in cell wall biosynthesis
MTALRIGFDAHVLDGKYQGSQTVILRLAEALATHSDVEITLYAQQERPVPASFGRRIIYKPLGTKSSLGRLLWELPRLSFQDRLDATIFQYIAPPWAKKSAVVIHDVLPITHPHLFSANFVARSVALYTLSMMFSGTILAVSAYTAKQISHLFPMFRHKVHVVRNGPSFHESVYFRPHAADSVQALTGGRRYALAVGRIEARKNIDLAVEAFLRAGTKDACFVVVGKLDNGFKITFDDSRIVHLQDINEDILVALCGNADLFLYPSEAEGFGLPLLDAVLFGIPTISSNQTAMPEVGGDLAEYFDPRATNAVDLLAERIRGHFTGYPVERPSLKARRRHAEAFSWHRSAATLVDALRRDAL